MNRTRLIALCVPLLALLLAGCGGDGQDAAGSEQDATVASGSPATDESADADQPPVAPSDESPQSGDSLSTEASAALAVMEDMIVYARTPEFQGQLSSFSGDPLQVNELKGLLDEDAVEFYSKFPKTRRLQLRVGERHHRGSR